MSAIKRYNGVLMPEETYGLRSFEYILASDHDAALKDVTDQLAKAEYDRGGALRIFNDQFELYQSARTEMFAGRDRIAALEGKLTRARELLGETETERSRLQSANDELRQDAIRYRWLRANNGCKSNRGGPVAIALPSVDEPDAEENWHEPSELDGAIDAALLTEPDA